MSEIALTRLLPTSGTGRIAASPLRRRDGVAKVTGAATYAADNNPPGLLHAVMAVSQVARGRVTFLDVEAAMRIRASSR